MGDLDTQPAPPLLASTLLALEETRDRLRLPPASTGLASLDELALDGGFRYGEITSIAGTSGMGKTLVCYCISRPASFAFLEVRWLGYAPPGDDCCSPEISIACLPRNCIPPPRPLQERSCVHRYDRLLFSPSITIHYRFSTRGAGV